MDYTNKTITIIILGFCIIIILNLFIFISDLPGSPSVIKDNRIENLNGFPTIGRGYSIYSNRLQSMCFEKVYKTKPTFDLDYELTEVTGEFFRKISVSPRDRLSVENLNNFVKKYYQPKETEGTKDYNLKNIIVNLEIKSYNYSLDETRSILSKSAKQLLEKKQYVAFFNSCGHHYVRAVGSFSTYLALLQYRSSDNEKSDAEFKKNLEKGLFNFNTKNNSAKNLMDDASYRGLRVYIKGVGLSKGNMVNLIPVDIDQFRQTIQDAVKLMQDPNSGVISSMEIVPWIENPELVIFIGKDLKEGDQQFVRQQRLESNSGIITEINRVSTQQVEQYYKANMCRKHLYENYVDKESRIKYDQWLGITSDETKKFQSLTELIELKVVKFDMDKTLFYNSANENDPDLYISIDEFIRYFAQNPPDDMLKTNKDFLYGTEDGSAGALDCADKLYKIGLEVADYRTIPSCVNFLKYNRLGTNFLDQYCMPKPARLTYKKDTIIKKSDSDKIKKNDDIKDIKDKNEKIDKPRDLKDLMDKNEPDKKSIPEKKNPFKILDDIKD